MTQATLSAEPTTSAPDWLASEMPAGYQNRLAEIERLSADLRTMERFGRLLYASGPALAESVRDAFAALKFDTELRAGEDTSVVVVRLEGRRRLLLHVSGADRPIERKSPDIAHIFQLLHESTEGDDRVVLVANSDATTRPKERTESIAPDALNFLRRMGANFLASPVLFTLWSLSNEDTERARKYVDRLHGQDGGAFQL